MCAIFGILNEDNNVIPILYQKLQHLVSEYGDYDSVGVATLKEGYIQQQKLQNKLHDLPGLLPQEAGHFAIAYTHHPNHHQAVPYCHHAQLYAKDHLAVVYNGFIDNIDEIQEELLGLGYQLNDPTESEVLLCLINRYLERGMSAAESTMLATMRLHGYFSTMVLFTSQEDLLIAVCRGSPLAMGVNENGLYMSSNTNTLNTISRQVIPLPEGCPIVLRSVKEAQHNLMFH